MDVKSNKKLDDFIGLNIRIIFLIIVAYVDL